MTRLVSYRGPGRPVVPGRRRPVVPARPSVYCPGFSQSIFLNVPVVPARLFVREGGGGVSRRQSSRVVGVLSRLLVAL